MKALSHEYVAIDKNSSGGLRKISTDALIRQLKTLYANCFRVFTSHSVYEYSLGKNNKRVLINNVAALVPAVAMAGVSAVGMRRTKRGKSTESRVEDFSKVK